MVPAVDASTDSTRTGHRAQCSMVQSSYHTEGEPHAVLNVNERKSKRAVVCRVMPSVSTIEYRHRRTPRPLSCRPRRRSDEPKSRKSPAPDEIWKSNLEYRKARRNAVPRLPAAETGSIKRGAGARRGPGRSGEQQQGRATHDGLKTVAVPRHRLKLRSCKRHTDGTDSFRPRTTLAQPSTVRLVRTTVHAARSPMQHRHPDTAPGAPLSGSSC